MVAAIFRRRKLSDRTLRDFAKETGLTAKYTFIVLTLTDKPPSDRYIRAMREIAERRNQFVHYKWAYHAEEERKKQDREYRHAIEIAEKVVRHYRTFERRHIKHRISF